MTNPRTSRRFLDATAPGPGLPRRSSGLPNPSPRPSHTRRSRPGRRLGACLGAALLLAGCGADAPPPSQPPLVTVETPERRDVPVWAYFTGNTRARMSAEIRARATGVLEEMYVEPSTLVTEGQTLFLIEPERYEALRDEALAALNSARAERARAESDLERLELALQTDAVSEAEVDRARALRDQAIAAVAAAEAALWRAEFNLENTRVKTPISGQVSRNLVDLGNLVSGDQATLLTTVNAIDPIHVYFDVPESAVLTYLNRADRGIVAGDAGPVAVPGRGGSSQGDGGGPGPGGRRPPTSRTRRRRRSAGWRSPPPRTMAFPTRASWTTSTTR